MPCSQACFYIISILVLPYDWGEMFLFFFLLSISDNYNTFTGIVFVPSLDIFIYLLIVHNHHLTAAVCVHFYSLKSPAMILESFHWMKIWSILLSYSIPLWKNSALQISSTVLYPSDFLTLHDWTISYILVFCIKVYHLCTHSTQFYPVHLHY